MRGLAIALLVGTTVGACGSATLGPEQIVPAFITATQDAARTMHMEWQGTFEQVIEEDPGSDMAQALTGSFDFSGPDYAGTITTSFGGGGGNSQVAYARVGGISFTNYGGGGWQESDPLGINPIEIDPMRGLSAGDLAYEAAETLDGRAVHRLRVADPVAVLDGTLFPSTAFENIRVAPGGRSDYVVFVDAVGVPVAAHMAVDLLVGMIDSGFDVDLTYGLEFDYRFSLWGEPVTISPPQVTGGGFDEPAPPGGGGGIR